MGRSVPGRAGENPLKKRHDFQPDLPYHTVIPVGCEESPAKSPAVLDILVGML